MIRLVLTTFSGAEDAAKVVRTLVEEKLAACGSILPGVRSIYHWEGKIEDSPEVLVLLKTAAACHSKMEARLRELHPYETPEIITLDPEAVSGDYARWVMNTCQP